MPVYTQIFQFLRNFRNTISAPLIFGAVRPLFRISKSLGTVIKIKIKNSGTVYSYADLQLNYSANINNSQLFEHLENSNCTDNCNYN